MAGQSANEQTATSPYEDTLARRWHRRRLNLTLLAAVAGIILALWLGQALTRREFGYAKALFKGAAGQWSAALQRVVADRVGRVSTTAAFIYGSDINDRKDFHAFVSRVMKSTTSIEMLAWAPRIPAARRSAHEEAVRKGGYPKYVISDRDDRGRFFAAGKRDEYYPILFAEPLSENKFLLGLDLGFDAMGLAAMRQATATGHATMTVYTALSGNNISDNVLCVLERARYESVASQLAKRPADQPEADGFVLGLLSMEALAKRWLSHPAINLPPSIDIYIAANGKGLVFRKEGSPLLPAHGAAAASAPTEPPLGGALLSENFEVGDANFTVVFVAPARYLAESGTRKPLVASLTGLLITGLVVGYFWLLTGRMASVERQVADRWLELRERERYIRHLVDNTGDAIFLCEQQGKILDINQRACDSLGYSREELLLMTTADVELPVVAEDPGPLGKRSAEEYPRTFESVYQRKDGTTFPVEVHLTSVGSSARPLLLAIVRDITDRKSAERAS
jgi:PAS domain S-box-containing protein